MYVKFNYCSPVEDNVFVYKVLNLLYGMICFLSIRNVTVSHAFYNFINVLTIDHQMQWLSDTCFSKVVAF